MNQSIEFAQNLYDAWAEACRGIDSNGRPLPCWPALSPRNKRAWNAVAEAADQLVRPPAPVASQGSELARAELNSRQASIVLFGTANVPRYNQLRDRNRSLDAISTGTGRDRRWRRADLVRWVADRAAKAPRNA